MSNHLKQSHAAHAYDIKLAVRTAFKYTAGFHTLDYISDILDETLFYPESTMPDDKTPCREVFLAIYLSKATRSRLKHSPA